MMRNWRRCPESGVPAHQRSRQVDAVIASDLAVSTHAHSIGLEVHMSVQANVCNMASVRFNAQYADVVVLARELTLGQIRRIIDGIRDEGIRGPSGDLIRVEIFAHGALYVAVSGKCHMSLAAALPPTRSLFPELPPLIYPRDG